MKVDKASIRKRLSSYYDDVSFNALCIDHFPEVYNLVTSQMDKQDKINRLFDYCDRHDGKWEHLIDVINQNRVLRLPSERVKPHFFDLSRQVEMAIRAYKKNHSGLIGLAVPCPYHEFYENFCERLVMEIGRNRLFNLHGIHVGSSITYLHSVLKDVEDELTYQANQHDVILHLEYLPETKIIYSFWHELSNKLTQVHLPNRLIVILPIDPDCQEPLPANLIQLERPVFSRMDASNWVWAIADFYGFPEHAVLKIIDEICARCEVDRDEFTELDVQRMYIHIRMMNRWLQEELSVEEILNEFEKRRRYYEQAWN